MTPKVEEVIGAPVTEISSGINHISISPNGDEIATSDVRLNVRVHRGNNLIFERNFQSDEQKVRPTERIRSVRFSNDCRDLFVAAADTLYRIDLRTGTPTWSYVPPRSFGFLVISPLALAVSRDGDVAASFDDGSMVFWDRECRQRLQFQDNEAPKSMDFLPDGNLVGVDGFCIAVWETRSGKKIGRIPLQSRAYAMSVSPTAPIVAVRSLTDVVVWDVIEGRPVLQLPVEAGLPLLQFHPLDGKLAVGGRNSVTVYERDGAVAGTFTLEDANVISLAFSPIGQRLHVGTSKDEILMFSMTS